MGALFSLLPAPEAGPLKRQSSLCATSSSSLVIKYADLAAQLPSKGFEEAAIAAARGSFADKTPRLYADPPWSLPRNAVRVLALTIGDAQLTDTRTGKLAELALAAARDLKQALPPGTETWLPERKGLHATIFHPGLAPGTVGTPGMVAPSEAQLDKELHTARRLAANVPTNLTLVVDRVVATTSGVMLLLLRPEQDGGRVCVESIRSAAHALFPDAARKQAQGVVHVSLLRILSLPAGQFGPAGGAAKRAAEVCRSWSDKLRGMRVSARGLLYVREEQIMTLLGRKTRLPFAGRRRRRLAPVERKLFRWIWGDRSESVLSLMDKVGRAGSAAAGK